MTSDNSVHNSGYRLSEKHLKQFLHFQDSSTFLSDFFNENQLILLKSRPALRTYLKARGLMQPEFISSENFEPLSAWAVERNSFPLIMKSATNQSNSKDIFLLKAFRELPVFFENISASEQKKIMLESYFPAKARIEATYFNGKRILISQIGIAKSLMYRHSWRVFPITPPGKCLKEMARTEEILAEFLSVKDIPYRISFAFNPAVTVPLSINAGFNRLEYFEPWGNFIHNPDQAMKDKTISKLLFFHLEENQVSNVNEDEIRQILRSTLKEMAVGKTTAILLNSADAALILEDSKKADAYFKHLHQEIDIIEDRD
jgi:hypothetical protein